MAKFENEHLDFTFYDWWWKQRNISITDVCHEVGLVQQEDARIGWKRASAFPSEVHVELMKIGAIPDPYVGFNEHSVQWIGDVEWLYKCTFSRKSSSMAHTYARLIFEGLDTICDVYLNNQKIISTDNMFRTYIHQLTENLLEENTLLLHFKSAKALAKVEELKYGKVRAGSTNLGDPSRVYVRKAQYDWRWDWGPELMTCGPYRPITLITYTTCVQDVHARTSVNVRSNGSFTASLKIDVTLIGSWSPSADILLVELTDSQNQVIRSERVKVQKWGDHSQHSEFVHESIVKWLDLENHVELWWPVGYGKQALYNVRVSLISPNDTIIDERTHRIGFRTAELIQEPLLEADQYGNGTTFLFEINGVRMFMGGSNWVPADNFLTQINEDRRRRWLTLLRDGNQNMVRLWGGGVYQPDLFYDICDELGLLVWQDFQFACGVYPAHDEFVASVRQEVKLRTAKTTVRKRGVTT